MAQYGAARSRPVPGDRPRRPGEDPIRWALVTGRITPDRVPFWRRQIAAAGEAAGRVLESLAPGCAPVTSAGQLVHAAAGQDDDMPPEPDGLFSDLFGAESEPDGQVAAAWDPVEVAFAPDPRRARIRQQLETIVGGGAVAAGITQVEAREQLEQMDREDREARR